MHKMLNITWKDLILLVRDRAALILMLAAPFVLTLGLGAVTGGFSSQSGGIGDIPLILINQDQGKWGGYIEQAIRSEGLADLFTTTVGSDVSTARRQVENDEAAALILVPSRFSDSFTSDTQSGQVEPTSLVEIYTSPERPNSASIIRSVVSEIINGLQAGPAGVQVALDGLISSGRLAPDQQAIQAIDVGLQQAVSEQSEEAGIIIHQATGAQAEQNQQPNVLNYLAPAMAVFFLMYTVTQGGRSILIEREYGTLARMLTTPTSNAQVLGGKVFGIFIAGVLQVGVLVLGSSLLFGLGWGDPLAVGLLIVAVCLAATGWGVFLASVATSPWQVGGVGSALMLIFGLLGGSFVSVAQFSEPVRRMAMITPNYWFNTGILTLMSGSSLAGILNILGALLLMAAALFVISMLTARKRWASGFARK
jgi:ABC-2 type transport system permease protein